jgi:hypothetical protein
MGRLTWPHSFRSRVDNGRCEAGKTKDLEGRNKSGHDELPKQKLFRAERQLIAEIEPAHGVGDETVESLQQCGLQLDKLAT